MITDNFIYRRHGRSSLVYIMPLLKWNITEEEHNVIIHLFIIFLTRCSVQPTCSSPDTAHAWVSRTGHFLSRSDAVSSWNPLRPNPFPRSSSAANRDILFGPSRTLSQPQSDPRQFRKARWTRPSENIILTPLRSEGIRVIVGLISVTASPICRTGNLSRKLLSIRWPVVWPRQIAKRKDRCWAPVCIRRCG